MMAKRRKGKGKRAKTGAPYREQGNRLRISVLALGVTQREICENLNISETRWSNWQAGTRKPDAIELARYANMYDIPLDYIYRNVMAWFSHDMLSRILKITRQESELGEDSP